MSHPSSCRDPECTLTYAEHLRLVNIAAAATPNRRRGSAVTSVKDKVLARDLDAYKRLRRSGVQPPHTDGCARLEATADHRWQIESKPRLEGES